MVTQITSGIKISVTTNFEGTFYKDYKMHFAFGYKITIENLSEDTVQLLSRHWEVLDALNTTETVDGEGVVGKKPVIAPGKSHVYSSGCLLSSPIGAMQGYYNLINLNTNGHIKATIPNFKLSAPFAVN
ncbi:Co2+/Mg2+ efflux protein ApaG [Spongiivirga sp. MCCC 1A20706]|uniref:Co2+/Mg2+ efflux protein ApaG n=1 Tax=Spongiivirga sp. MCCC 1A20706 TaxID=3160963 RepID=UPI0039776808